MSRRKLPLESPHWLPILEALEHRTQRTGSDELARADFNQALKTGQLRALVRRADGHRELLAASAWSDFHVVVWAFGGPPRSRMAVFSRKLGSAPRKTWFYVWLPDYKNIFGDPQAQSQRPEQVLETPRKRGRKADHPWPAIGVELVRRVSKKVKFPARPSTNSLATELWDWCMQRYEKAPADSELRAFIDGVLDALRLPRA